MRILYGHAPAFETKVPAELARWGIHCDIVEPLAGTGAKAEQHGPYDAVLLQAPDAGRTIRGVLRDLGRRGLPAPVLVLAGNPSAAAERALLMLGADAVLRHPVPAAILAPRLRAAQRQRLADTGTGLVCAGIALDRNRRSARVDGRPVALTPREFDALEILLRHRGMALTKEYFLHLLYAGEECPGPRILDVLVCKLRRKLAACGAAGIIRTFRGHGYAAMGPDRTMPSTAGGEPAAKAPQREAPPRPVVPRQFPA